jgi:hypothetical protein
VGEQITLVMDVNKKREREQKYGRRTISWPFWFLLDIYMRDREERTRSAAAYQAEVADARAISLFLLAGEIATKK